MTKYTAGKWYKLADADNADKFQCVYVDPVGTCVASYKGGMSFFSHEMLMYGDVVEMPNE